MKFPKPKFTKQRDKTRKRQREYRVARDRFLFRHPKCQVGIACRTEVESENGVTVFWGDATEVHHRSGRGEHFLNVDSWLAVCHECHAWIHAHPAVSYERGWLTRRNSSEEESNEVVD